MDNFLKFIEEDIEAKKTLLSTMPTSTKTNIKRYNEKIEDIKSKYDEYYARVKKYIVTKSRSYNLREKENKKDKIRENIHILEHVKFIINPTNTYFEKMGFDSLLFDISNYYDFNFNSLNDIINKFLDKFELAGIKLFHDDFDYTCYVKEYMTAFLDGRYKKNETYDRLSEIFEKIYWVNPELVSHIELNFRKLIKKHQKQFINYIVQLQKEVMYENNINNYKECIDRLKSAYIELKNEDKENICDIIEKAKQGEIDINKYFEDSKVRTTTFSSLMIDPLNLEDKVEMGKFYESLSKLKNNIEEYSNYLKFIPLFEDFKKTYGKEIPKEEKVVSKGNSSLKTIEIDIEGKENKLEKINKKILGGEPGIFEFMNNTPISELKISSIKLAKELYELYRKYDEENFKSKVQTILNSSITISDILHLYYSYDYYKKNAIRKVFGITTYEEITKNSEEFDLFAMDPTNIIIHGVRLFEDSNIAKVIMNKYRLDNINISEEDIEQDNLDGILEKINLVLRVNEIENSPTTVEKIWFMSQIEKIIALENKKTS